jgi:hypothetical protein
MNWIAIDDFARHQHGLVTLEQLRDSGGTDWTIRQCLKQGLLRSVRRGVYAIAGSTATDDQRIMAACLSLGPEIFASHDTAGSQWGFELPAKGPQGRRRPGRSLDAPRPEMEFVVPRGHHSTSRGLYIHTSSLLVPDDVTTRNGIPLTSPARTLVDLSARHPEPAIASEVQRLRRRRLLTLEELAACRARLGYGTGWERTLRPDNAVNRLRGLHPGDSAPEFDLGQVLVDGGLPRPEPQYRVVINGKIYIFDHAYADYLVAPEYDGWRHGLPENFDPDRTRTVDVQAAGWLVLPFTSKSTREFIVARTWQALIGRGWSPGRAA